MSEIIIAQIEERLRRLPSEKLTVIYDFVSYLSDRQADQQILFEATETALASEAILRQDWEKPEEDAAWAVL